MDNIQKAGGVVQWGGVGPLAPGVSPKEGRGAGPEGRSQTCLVGLPGAKSIVPCPAPPRTPARPPPLLPQGSWEVPQSK